MTPANTKDLNHPSSTWLVIVVTVVIVATTQKIFEIGIVRILYRCQ